MKRYLCSEVRKINFYVYNLKTEFLILEFMLLFLHNSLQSSA